MKSLVVPIALSPHRRLPPCVAVSSFTKTIVGVSLYVINNTIIVVVVLSPRAKPTPLLRTVRLLSSLSSSSLQIISSIVLILTYIFDGHAIFLADTGCGSSSSCLRIRNILVLSSVISSSLPVLVLPDTMIRGPPIFLTDSACGSSLSSLRIRSIVLILSSVRGGGSSRSLSSSVVFTLVVLGTVVDIVVVTPRGRCRRGHGLLVHPPHRPRDLVSDPVLPVQKEQPVPDHFRDRPARGQHPQFAVNGGALAQQRHDAGADRPRQIAARRGPRRQVATRGQSEQSAEPGGQQRQGADDETAHHAGGERAVEFGKIFLLFLGRRGKGPPRAHSQTGRHVRRIPPSNAPKPLHGAKGGHHEAPDQVGKDIVAHKGEHDKRNGQHRGEPADGTLRQHERVPAKGSRRRAPQRRRRPGWQVQRAGRPVSRDGIAARRRRGGHPPPCG